MNAFQEPMCCWSSLAPYAKKITLKQVNVQLHVYDAGPEDAPALLLVHGLGDESDSWRHIIHPLAEHQRVIALDLPGFGRSEPLARYFIVTYIRVLLDLLDTLSISSAVFIGSSLGGILSHSMAIMHPDRVNELVLLDGHLGIGKQKIDLGTLLFMVPGIGEWRYNRYRKDAQMAYNSLIPFYANLLNLPEADREFLFQRVNKRVWSDTQRQAYLGILRNTASWLTKQQSALLNKMKSLAIPTLIIYGEQDQIIPVGNANMLTELQPSARLIVLPGVGHLPQQEAPDKLLSVIKKDPKLSIKL